MSQNRICVAAIAGAFGVKGDLRLKSFCADPDAVAQYGTLWSEDGTMGFDVTLGGPIKNGFAARIDGITTKEQADALTGTKLFADREALPNLPDDEFYHNDLIGLKVYDTGGKELGRVTAVNNHGAGDFLEIQGPGIKNEALLPFTRDAVPTVDLTAGRIVVDPPEGVFPE